MGVAFNVMAGIEVTVYAVQFRGFFCLLIIKVCIFTLFCKRKRKEIFVAFDAAAFKYMPPGNFKPSPVVPVE